MNIVDLNNLELISELDTENVYGSVEELPNQLRHAFEEASRVEVPEEYKNIENVVMVGMGGSGLGARVIESVYGNAISVPLIRINGYNLPSFVNEKSLVMASSYSGTTEEVLAATKDAFSQRAKLMVVAKGGDLIGMAQEAQIPFYQIDPLHNPSNQPRMAIGYSVVSQLVLAAKAGLFKFTEDEMLVAIDAMAHVISENSATIHSDNNPSKKLAHELKDRIVVYVSAEHLVGAMHTVNNQLNENAKTFSADFQIPELNHHLMEGLKHPLANPDNLHIFFADSHLYPEKIQKRFKVTRDIVNKNKIRNFSYKCQAPTKLAQAFELIQFGAYVNFYLSMLYGQNPSPIPWVDYFKEELKKS